MPRKRKKESTITQEKVGIRHLIECNCFLPQNMKKKIWHKFPVFSIVDENDKVIEKYAQCNNCGFVHKIVEIGKSEPTTKENSRSIRTIEEIKMGLPEVFAGILEQYHCDISVWEEVEFILEQKKWNSYIIISKEIMDDGSINGKALLIRGPTLPKIESFTRQEIIR